MTVNHNNNLQKIDTRVRTLDAGDSSRTKSKWKWQMLVKSTNDLIA